MQWLYIQQYSGDLSIFLKLHSRKHFVVLGFTLTIPNVATTVKNRHTRIRRRVENLQHWFFQLLFLFSQLRNKNRKDSGKKNKKKTREKLRLTNLQVVSFVVYSWPSSNRNDTWPETGSFSNTEGQSQSEHIEPTSNVQH